MYAVPGPVLGCFTRTGCIIEELGKEEQEESGGRNDGAMWWVNVLAISYGVEYLNYTVFVALT